MPYAKGPPTNYEKILGFVFWDRRSTIRTALRGKNRLYEYIGPRLMITQAPKFKHVQKHHLSYHWSFATPAA